jgi:hypothetical protein
MTMAIETALAWMRMPENRREFERLVQIGYLPAVRANNSWWAAKAAYDAKNGDFPRLRDYWLDVFNEYLVTELTKQGREEMLSRFDYKASDFGVKPS